MDRVRNLSKNFFDFEAVPNGNGESKKVDPSQRQLRLRKTCYTFISFAFFFVVFNYYFLEKLF